MWSDDYRMEQDNVKAPEFLKVKALQKMSESRKNQKNIFKLKPMWAMAFSSLVAIVIALNWVATSEMDPVTDLVFERLTSGSWHFAAIGDNEDQYAILAGADSAIKTSILDLALEGFHLEDAFQAVNENGVVIQHIFERNGASISVMLNDYTHSVSTNSILNDLPLALYYRVMLLETTFVAEFLHNGIYYQIEATGLNEEEFVDYLQEILIFLN